MLYSTTVAGPIPEARQQGMACTLAIPRRRFRLKSRHTTQMISFATPADCAFFEDNEDDNNDKDGPVPREIHVRISIELRRQPDKVARDTKLTKTPPSPSQVFVC